MTRTMKCSHDPLLSNMVCGMCAAEMVQDGYRAGIEAAAKLCDDAAAVPGTGRDGSVALSAAAYCIRALAAPAAPKAPCEHRWFRKEEEDLCIDCGARTNADGQPAAPKEEA